tara:strand:+ start:6766 stop:7125 length:360 start_codon:yes stop_codon:yes gene_type:complete
MEPNEIKKLLREAGDTKGVVRADSASSDDAKNNEKYDKIVKLLDNPVFNHAAIVRALPNEPWANNSEATNRSLFRKKLKRMNNDDGVEYSFSDETLSELQKVMMSVSSVITHSIGRQGN